ncbi:zinc metallochaperone AztD [Sanguibacter suaedae]|uniref:Secreted protein n=1 Tax=Sanguibacter suaedae TaxID=2795737 RepID=A0A934I5M0_9MICO|nr:hypothetical protein [Sanguibacter suaedae]
MTITSPARRRTGLRPSLALGVALPLAFLTACSGSEGATDGATADETTAAAAEVTEESAVKPRLAITYDGGIQVLDATTLEVLEDIELAGFNRINGAGDGRHLYVSTTGGFQVLDAGSWAEPHGDHDHYYSTTPTLTDVMFDAEKPGHVVNHDGRTALFDDGTGKIVVLDSADLVDPEVATREYTTPSAHHGVAVELSDGSLVVSEGTEDARTGIRVLDADDQEIAANDDCPGVHGEAMASDEAVVIGCETGAVVYRDGEITKVASPDAYGRIGNQAGSEESPIVLGDYKSDPDADLERPTRVSLIDTRTASLKLVDLPSSYTFRSLARGDDGEALVLGTDGQLHVIDEEAGSIERSIPVIDEWEEPEEWQEPRPTVFVLDGSAYVTDPATNSIHAVDIETGEVWISAELTVTPNELNGVSGAAEEGAHEHEGEDHAEHEGEEHSHEEGDEHSHEGDDHTHDDHDHEGDDHDHAHDEETTEG